jgi:hypothetical protein
MKKNTRLTTFLLLAAVICLGLAACGTGRDGADANAGPITTTSPNVIVKTGSIASDSWGYTGASAAQIAVPAKTGITIQGHTLLVDSSRAVVSGTIPTRISYSSDATTLTVAPPTTAKGNLVSYLDISLGSVKTAIPALSVTVDVTPVAPGVTLTVYEYDAGTPTHWIAPQLAVVSATGTITFPVDQLSLYAIYP